MKEIFETLRTQMREDQKDTPEAFLVSAGLNLLEQFMGDVHRIADALERIAIAQERLACEVAEVDE